MELFLVAQVPFKMTLIAALSKMPTSRAVAVGLGGASVLSFIITSIQHAGGAAPLVK